MGHTARVVVALVVGGLCCIASVAPATASATDAEASFVAMIAQERLGAGLAGYRIAVDLSEVARRQAASMAGQNRIFHNPSLTVQVAGWDVVGENVGRGFTVPDLHRAFMASDSHRREILSPRFTEVGVGVVESGGEIWVSQVFRLPTGSLSPAPATVAAAAAPTAPAAAPVRTASVRPAPTPAPAPRPAPVATTTAPTTTAAPVAATAVPTMVAAPTMALEPVAPAPGEASVVLAASAGGRSVAAAVPLAPVRQVRVLLVAVAAVMLLAVATGTARTALAPARATGRRRQPATARRRR